MKCGYLSAINSLSAISGQASTCLLFVVVAVAVLNVSACLLLFHPRIPQSIRNWAFVHGIRNCRRMPCAMWRSSSAQALGSVHCSMRLAPYTALAVTGSARSHKT